MVARARWGLALVVLLAGAAVPAGASEVAETTERLDGARTELAEVERTLQRVRDEVDAADDRLREAATELEAVRTELATAEEAMEAAEARERDTAAQLAAADARMRRAQSDWTESREQLQARAVDAYKRGSTATGEVLMRGLTGAADWHEVAVTLETVDRLVTDDRLLVDDTAHATRAAADARATTTEIRAEALTARRAADRERRRVEELVSARQAVVVRIEAEQDRRQQALERLESDASARAVLVRDLEARVQRLQASRTTPVVVPVDVDLDALGPPPAWASRLPAQGRPWAAAIDAAAAAHGIDGRLMAALVWTESNFRPDAVSHAGAIGLAQLMPGTARGLGVDPWDPLENLSGGAAYLRAQQQTFGRMELALAAYNAGPGRVSRAGNQIPNIVETQLYVVRVLERYEAIAGG